MNAGKQAKSGHEERAHQATTTHLNQAREPGVAEERLAEANLTPPKAAFSASGPTPER